MWDFDIYKQLINKNKADTKIGSENYLSPEIIKVQSFDYKNDIYEISNYIIWISTIKQPFKDNKINIEKKIDNIL